MRGAGSFLCILGCVLGLSACTGAPVKQEKREVSMQPVQVVTPGVTGAHCFLQAGDKNYTMAAGSRVMVARASDTLKVSCFKGPHMVGHTAVKPTVAPREEAHGRDACVSCTYPETVSVAMAMRAGSVRRDKIRIMQ